MESELDTPSYASGAVPEKTDDEGRRTELWPDFECPACRYDGDVIRWEESSYPEDADDAPASQQYDGREPCCFRCGTRVTPTDVEAHRPPEWHQPFYRVCSGIEGMNTGHPAVQHLIDAFEREPEEFLTAEHDELTRVEGIGETFADRIHTTRAVVFPEETPPVDDHLYEFRGKRLRDVDTTDLARDLVIGHVDPDCIPTDLDEDERDTVREVVETLRERSDDPFWRGGRDEEEVVKIADDIASRLP